MDLIRDIAAVVGCTLSVLSLFTLLTKAGRAFIKSLFVKNTKKLEEENQRQTQDIEEIKTSLSTLLQKFNGVEEVSKQQCRNIIKNIYYKYRDKKLIPLYERKTADATWTIYHKRFNGNSYIKLLYQEICKWEIDSNFQDRFISDDED